MTITPIRRPDPDPPVDLRDHAFDNLRYIRRTMQSSGEFTALSGLGGVILGITGLAAGWIAAGSQSAEGWLITWLVAAAVGIPPAGWAVYRKARNAGVALFRGVGRKFVLGFVPALFAGAVLTAVLFREGLVDLLPGLWLLLHGVGVVTAGSFSARIIPALGISFMLLGVGALFAPATWGNSFVAAGFGGLHLGFGLIIMRRYGG